MLYKGTRYLDKMARDKQEAAAERAAHLAAKRQAQTARWRRLAEMTNRLLDGALEGAAAAPAGRGVGAISLHATDHVGRARRGARAVHAVVRPRRSDVARGSSFREGSASEGEPPELLA